MNIQNWQQVMVAAFQPMSKMCQVVKSLHYPRADHEIYQISNCQEPPAQQPENSLDGRFC